MNLQLSRIQLPTITMTRVQRRLLETLTDRVDGVRTVTVVAKTTPEIVIETGSMKRMTETEAQDLVEDLKKKMRITTQSLMEEVQATLLIPNSTNKRKMISNDLEKLEIMMSSMISEGMEVEDVEIADEVGVTEDRLIPTDETMIEMTETTQEMTTEETHRLITEDVVKVATEEILTGTMVEIIAEILLTIEPLETPMVMTKTKKTEDGEADPPKIDTETPEGTTAVEAEPLVEEITKMILSSTMMTSKIL